MMLSTQLTSAFSCNKYKTPKLVDAIAFWKSSNNVKFTGGNNELMCFPPFFLEIKFKETRPNISPSVIE